MLLEHQSSNKEINENQEKEKNNETKKILLNLINEIIIGTFSSNEEIKESYSLIKTKYYNIKQYYTYNQNIGYLCGFHSLFNIYYFIQYLTSKDLTQKNIYLYNLKNAWSFWTFYRESRDYLISNLSLEKSAIESLRNEGPLERYQFIFLLNNFPKMKKLLNEIKLEYDISFTKFLYGFNIFNGTLEEGIYFQNKISEFNIDNNNNKKKILIILLGIVNHWNILLLHKNKENNMDMYLLDSRNSPEIFDMFELYEKKENINNNVMIRKARDEYVNKIMKKKIKNKKINEWYVKLWKEWYDSMNISLGIILKVIKKEINLINYIIHNKIKILINNFTSKTNIDLNELNKNSDDININIINNNKEIIFKFLKEDYHPAVVKDELLYDISKVKYTIEEKELISWIRLIKLFLNIYKQNKNLDEIDRDIIIRYDDIINNLSIYIK